MENVHGFVDIVKLFKEKHPHETQNSLAFMTEKLLGKKISKFEQRSNWNRRPLKRTQMHYAALDAQICLELFENLVQGGEKTFAVEKKKQSRQEKYYRDEHIVYNKKYQELLHR